MDRLATTLAAISRTRQDSSASAACTAGAALSSHDQSNPRKPHTRSQYRSTCGRPSRNLPAPGPPNAMIRAASTSCRRTSRIQPATTSEVPRRTHSASTLSRGVRPQCDLVATDGLWYQSPLVGRQREPECRSAALLGFRPDVSAVPFDRAVHGGQPDAGAREVLGAVQPGKRPEQLARLPGRKTGPVVTDEVAGGS